MSVKIEFFGETAADVLLDLRAFSEKMQAARPEARPVTMAPEATEPESDRSQTGAEPEPDLKPVRGKNAEALAQEILEGKHGDGAARDAQIGRLPKAQQDMVRQAIEKPAMAAAEQEPEVIDPAEHGMTGEEHVEPEPQPQEPAIRATPENREEPAPAPTRDDLRNAMSAYAGKHGMPMAQSEGPKILGFAKISGVPESELGAAIERVQRATAAANGKLS